MATKFTQLQKQVLIKVARATLKETHYRASSNGERVTLASLFAKGWLVRRAHRGVEGQANAAHEYELAPQVREAVLDVIRETKK